MGKLIEKLSSWTRGLPLTNPKTAGFLFQRESSSGREVGPSDAMSLSAVFSAVRLISQVIGMLPLTVYQTKSEGGKRPALTDPVYKLLRNTPNPWMTAKSFRQTMEVHRLLWGGAYAEIVWNYGGGAGELWLLEPWRVKPVIQDGDLRYSIDGGQSYIAKEDMLHVPLISFDGVTGQSFIDFAIDSLGLNLSAQDFAGSFFANGATTSGILYKEGDAKPELRKEVRENWENRHVGQGKGYRTGVLWGGWKYQADAGQTDPEKSQLLEQRQFGISEVARWLNMPPHLLRDLSRSTFSNIEEEQIGAVTYSWMPIAIDYEQEYDRKLLNPPQTYCKHNFTSLLRGNSKDRAEFYSKIFAVGGMSVNRILELEDEDPIGPMGDLRFVPLNMQTLQEAERKSSNPGVTDPAPEPAPPVDPAGDPPSDPPEDPMFDPSMIGQLWMQDTLNRLLKKELNQLQRAAAQPKQFISWLDSFYGDHQEVLTAALAPAAQAASDPALAGRLAGIWIEQSKQELLELSGSVNASQLSGAVQQLADRWKVSRAAATLARLKE
jgi:HK97 family phage portal protein